MNWYKNLYTGETIREKKKQMIQAIEKGKIPINLFLITLSEQEGNQLEIIPAFSIRFWYKNRSIPMIIGMAGGKKEAFELVRQITEQIYQETGSTEIKRFITSAGN